MRSVLLALLLLAGCGQTANNQAPSAPQPRPVPAPQPARPAAPAPTTNQIGPHPVGPDPAEISGLSPSQRRAYQRGYADCQAGRYDPDPFPEAYRIGCAAAHDH